MVYTWIESSAKCLQNDILYCPHLLIRVARAGQISRPIWHEYTYMFHVFSSYPTYNLWTCSASAFEQCARCIFSRKGTHVSVWNIWQYVSYSKNDNNDNSNSVGMHVYFSRSWIIQRLLMRCQSSRPLCPWGVRSKSKSPSSPDAAPNFHLQFQFHLVFLYNN